MRERRSRNPPFERDAAKNAAPLNLSVEAVEKPFF